MSILDDLHTSISEMSDEELAETFRQVRLSRRTAKPRKKKAKAKTTTAPPAINTLSPEMAAKLLEQLGG